MLEDHGIDEFLATVQGASALAAASEQRYVFVFFRNTRWQVTAAVDVWTSAGESALMVHPDGRDDYVEAGNWQEVLALHRVRDEARRKNQTRSATLIS